MNRTCRRAGVPVGAFVLGLLALAVVPALTAEDLYVDCSEGNPSGSPYTSINAAIGSITHSGSARVLLRSDCTENVVINRSHTTIAPEWDPCPQSGCTTNGPLARIAAANTGGAAVRVSGASDVTLVHLALSGGSAGLSLNDGAGVTAYGVVAELNQDGISLNDGSRLSMQEGGALDNQHYGLFAGMSTVSLSGQSPSLQNQPLVIGSNGHLGIRLDRSHLAVTTGVVIENNAGWGLLSYGGDTTFGAYAAETIVRGNQGGFFITEGSEISFWGKVTLRDNGPYGVYVEGSSHATFYETGSGAPVVEGHSEDGVNVTAGSQASFHGAVKVSGNGGAGRPWSAGVRVDGHSQAFFEQGIFTDRPEVTANTGPGVLVDLSSGLDAPSAIFQGNTAEAVRVRHLSVAHLGDGTVLGTRRPLVCDNTSLVVTDLVGPTVACRKVEPRRTVPRPVRPEPDLEP